VSAPKEQIGRNWDGTFALEIRTPRDLYAANEAIPVAATIAYSGPARAVASSEYPSLVYFGLEQLDGPIDMSGGLSRLVCHRVDVDPAAPRVVAFTKSGAWTEEQPLAGFWRSYFAEKELRLPAGAWRITASLSATLGPDCSGGKHELDASVMFHVHP
jgi:hypothetical protein